MHLSIGIPDQAFINAIGLSGYKAAEKHVELSLGNLTVLAGANSSGKSTVMQPLLLMKQTLESTTDPGALAIDGPNVYFSSAKHQMFSWHRDGSQARSCVFDFGLTNRSRISLQFTAGPKRRVALQLMRFELPDAKITLREGMTEEEILTQLPSLRESLDSARREQSTNGKFPKLGLYVKRDRCLLYLQFGLVATPETVPFGFTTRALLPTEPLAEALKRCIHVPAFRNISERVYPWNEPGPGFPGEFDEYTGSVLASWRESNPQMLRELSKDLRFLGLTSNINALPTSDVSIAISVDLFGTVKRGARKRIPKKRMVNIADVGFGVSQVLPVLVALRAASPEHLVYVEEPESHLHPKAQHALASVVASAVARGVRVVLETHSSILLVGIQEAIARGQLESKAVRLHWLQRQSDGIAVTEAAVASDGSYGAWPVDFDNIMALAQANYVQNAFQKTHE